MDAEICNIIGESFKKIGLTKDQFTINVSNKKILQLYFVHLFFNGIWSIIFFGFHQIFIALIDLGINPSSLNASSAEELFKLLSMAGNNAIAPIPRS